MTSPTSGLAATDVRKPATLILSACKCLTKRSCREDVITFTRLILSIESQKSHVEPCSGHTLNPLTRVSGSRSFNNMPLDYPWTFNLSQMTILWFWEKYLEAVSRKPEKQTVEKNSILPLMNGAFPKGSLYQSR